MAPEQARGLKDIDRAQRPLLGRRRSSSSAVTGPRALRRRQLQRSDVQDRALAAPEPARLAARPRPRDSAADHRQGHPGRRNERFETADQFATPCSSGSTQGVVSVRTPELRRGSRTTPRTSGQLRATPSPGQTPTPAHAPDRPEARPRRTPLDRPDARPRAHATGRPGTHPWEIALGWPVAHAGALGGPLAVAGAGRAVAPVSAQSLIDGGGPTPLSGAATGPTESRSRRRRSSG